MLSASLHRANRPLSSSRAARGSILLRTRNRPAVEIVRMAEAVKFVALLRICRSFGLALTWSAGTRESIKVPDMREGGKLHLVISTCSYRRRSVCIATCNKSRPLHLLETMPHTVYYRRSLYVYVAARARAISPNITASMHSRTSYTAGRSKIVRCLPITRAHCRSD